MEVNTILIVGNIIINILTVIQSSKCSNIEISDCIKIRREVPKSDEVEARPVYPKL